MLWASSHGFKRLWKSQTAVRLLLLSVLLCSCRPSPPTPEPITISFAHPAGDTEYYEGLRSTFNQEHPHITVQLEGKSILEFDDVQNVLGADTFVVYPQTQLIELVDRGALLDLTSLIEQTGGLDLSDLHADTVDLCTVEGDLLVVPSNVDPVAMFYNKDLFDQRGVPYPEVDWTWDDFVRKAVDLRDDSAGIYGYGADPFLALLAIYQHGGQIVDDWKAPTRTTFDDPRVIEAVEWYADLIHKHDAASPLQAFTSPQEGWLFGKIAMGAFALSGRGGTSGTGWAQEWSMRWGVAPLPRDQRASTLATVEGYGISATTSHPDASWEWVRFLSEQMPHRAVPVRASILESAAYREQVGAETAEIVQAAMAQDAVLVYPQNQALLMLFVQATARALSGQATAQEAMQQAQQQSPFR